MRGGGCMTLLQPPMNKQSLLPSGSSRSLRLAASLLRTRRYAFLAASATAALCACLPLGRCAEGATINSLAADAVTLRNTTSGNLSAAGQTTSYLQVGNNGSGSDEAIVFVFQVPATVLSDSSQVFDTASFKVRLGSNAMPGTTNGDLYGLGYRTSSAVLAGDFYAGAADANATLIAGNFLTGSSPAYGDVTASASALTTYLNTQLAAARAAGASSAYLFLRVSPDAIVNGGHALVAMSEAGGAAVPSLTYTTATVGFRNVAVGGGGYVTGVFADPHVNGLFYARTDIGGAYRWDTAGATWIPITDKRSGDDFGIESVAVDPVNANTLYILTGKYTYSTPHLYKSTDAGNTWTTLAVPAGLHCNANGGSRANGERLQVEPNNASVLYLASRNIGTWKSVNGGAAWTQVAGVPVGKADLGQSYVVFDKNGGTTGGASAVIYVGVYNPDAGQTDGGVWKSVNGGASWAQMTDAAPSYKPARAAVAADGTFYGTFGEDDGVRKAARSSSVLADVTPSTPVVTSFRAVAVNPVNAAEVLVSRTPSGSEGPYNSPTWRTTDAGGTWSLVSNVKGAGNLPTRDGTHWFGNISSLVYNPFNVAEVWMGDFVGVLRTQNITSTTAPWDFLYKGHEEIVPLTLVCAPTGAPLLSGAADINGVRHASLDAPPAKGFTQSSSPASYGSTTGMDFCESDPTVWARVLDVFTATSTGYYSTDDGQNWTKFASIPSGATGGRVAVSSVNSSNFVWVPENGTVYYTTNRGASWTKATGAPNVTSTEFAQDAQALASDRSVTGAYAGAFYLFKNVHGTPNGYAQIYRSLDSGATWTAVGTCPYVNNHADAYQYKILSAPGVSGEVWVNIGYNATYRSANGGTSFSVASGVSTLSLIAFGKPAPGHTNPALFLKGGAGGLSGILRSDDDGATWKKIDDADHPINDGPKVMGADRQTFGRVYIGTDGRGIYVGDSN